MQLYASPWTNAYIRNLHRQTSIVKPVQWACVHGCFAAGFLLVFMEQIRWELGKKKVCGYMRTYLGMELCAQNTPLCTYVHTYITNTPLHKLKENHRKNIIAWNYYILAVSTYRIQLAVSTYIHTYSQGNWNYRKNESYVCMYMYT